MNLLITGGAGFIGSNLIRHVIDKPEVARLVNLDCLTYAGHLENLAGIHGTHPRYAFEKVDLIGGPVSATAAFKLGEKSGDPLAMYLVDLYTVCTNLAGVGGISFPCGFTKGGLPIGFQLQAPALAEPLLLRATDRDQHLTDWHRRRPAIAARPR